MTTPHTPQQNGMAKCFNQTIHESTLTVLKDAVFSCGFWLEAHDYANYMHNHSPTKALAHSTPNKAFYGEKPSIATLHVFSFHYHVCIPSDHHHKLDVHSLNAIFCGFKHQSKAYIQGLGPH